MKYLLIFLNLHIASLSWSQLLVEELKNDNDIKMFLRQNKICEENDSISFSGLDKNYEYNYSKRFMDSSEYLKLKRNIIVDINNDGKLDIITKPLINGYTEVLSILSNKNNYCVYKINTPPFEEYIKIDTTRIDNQNVLLFTLPRYSTKLKRSVFLTDTLIGMNNGLVTYSSFKSINKPIRKVDSIIIKYSEFGSLNPILYSSNYSSSSNQISFAYSLFDYNKLGILDISNTFSIYLEDSMKNTIQTWINDSNLWLIPDSLKRGGYHHPTIEIILYSEKEKKSIYDDGTHNHWDLEYFYHNWFKFFFVACEEALRISKSNIPLIEY